MLEAFRKQSRSVLIYVFFGIIIAVFVINFGPQSQGCGGASHHTGFAAKVGAQDLSDGAFYFGWFAYNGPNMRPERARALRLKERIMSKLIEREIFAQEAERLGLRVGDRDVEEMLEDGRMLVLGVRRNVRGWIFKSEQFDRTLLERFVQFQLNTTLKRFMEEQRREMLAERMRDLVRGAVKLSADEIRRAYDQEHTRVNLEFVRFDPQKLELSDPTSPEIDAYAKEHKKEIEDYHKSHAFEFQKLKPQARVRQILFKLASDAKPDVEQKQLAAAKAALERARGGEDFTQLAAKLSEDDSARIRGGDLGYKEYKRFNYGTAGEKKLAEAKPGTVITEVLRSIGGFHVVKVEAKREGDVTLAQAEREIAEKLMITDRRKARARQMAEETLTKVKEGAKLELLFTKAEPQDEEAASQPSSAPKMLVHKAPPGTPKLEETGPFERRGNVVNQIGVSPDLAKAAFELKPAQPLMDKVYEVSGSFIIARLKERQDPNPTEFDKTKDEFARRQQAQKWGEILSDWAQRQCVAARDSGQIHVNNDLLTYEGKAGVETAHFQPCLNIY
jgi:parvulin-like peptidyl-prolyl isomerase